MGANRFKGEVEFEAGGKKYTFRLGTNDLIRLQDEMGLAEDDDAFLKKLDSIRGLKPLRQLVKAGLIRHHPEIEDAEVGDIIDALGSDGAGDLMKEAMRWMFPDPKAGGGKGKGGAASAGPSSSPTPLAPASGQTSSMS